MNKEQVLKLYPLGTKITFQSISKKVAEKLVEFAATNKVGETIKINGVAYELLHLSINGRYASVSIYFKSRNRLIRISDHWSAIQRGFAPSKSEIQPLKGVGRIATCFWQLVGDDQSFVPDVIFHATHTWRDYDPFSENKKEFSENVVIKNHVFEGGFVPLRQIDFQDERAARARKRVNKQSRE